MERSKSVDLVLLLSLLGIIALNSGVFDLNSSFHGTRHYTNIFVSHSLKFIMPFLFVISGYFWGLQIKRETTCIPFSIKIAKKTGIIILAWSFIYILPYNVSAFYSNGIFGPINLAFSNLTLLFDDPVATLLQGTKTHLWFFIAILFSLLICTIFVHKRWIIGLIVFSLGLYLFGVLSQAYSKTPVGIALNFNTRNGPFFGTLPFATGYLISGFRPKEKWLGYGLLLFCFGIVSHFSELIILRKSYETSLNQEFVFGTYFMGLGIAVLTLSNHPAIQFGNFRNITKFAIGIYSIHYIFIENLQIISNNFNSRIWGFLLIFLVFALSFIFSKLFSKYKYTEKLVE